MEWIQVLILLVSVSTAAISYFQWRTANDKVSVDLFERRLKIFEDVESVCGQILREARPDGASLPKITNALIYSRFLFGEDVEKFISRLREDVVFLDVFTDETIRAEENPVERQRLFDRKQTALQRLTSFQKEGHPVFQPYMRMRHKVEGWRII